MSSSLGECATHASMASCSIVKLAGKSYGMQEMYPYTLNAAYNTYTQLPMNLMPLDYNAGETRLLEVGGGRRKQRAEGIYTP